MEVSKIPVKAVPHLVVGAVLDTEPIPPYPEFDGEPLTLERLDNKKAWANNGRRRKALRVWGGFVTEVNGVLNRRNEKLVKLLLSRGVALEVPPMAEWGADLQALGVADNDPIMVKLLYVHHLVPDPLDKLELLTRIMAASGLESGMVDAVRGLFKEAAAGLEKAT